MTNTTTTAAGTGTVPVSISTFFSNLIAAAEAKLATFETEAEALAKGIEADVIADVGAVAPTILADAGVIVENYIATAITAASKAFSAGLSGQEHFSQVKTDVTQALEADNVQAKNSTINTLVSVGTSLAEVALPQAVAAVGQVESAVAEAAQPEAEVAKAA